MIRKKVDWSFVVHRALRLFLRCNFVRTVRMSAWLYLPVFCFGCVCCALVVVVHVSFLCLYSVVCLPFVSVVVHIVHISMHGFSRVTTRPPTMSGCFQKLAGRVGSGREVFEMSRVGSGQFGSGGVRNTNNRVGAPLPCPTREQ